MAATGPAGALPPPTLAHLVWGWGSAYAIGYGQDQWRAARRDGRAVLAAHTLAGLAAAIEADYRHRPVPREFDPPGIAPGDDDAPGDDEPFLLAALQAAFPRLGHHLRPRHPHLDRPYPEEDHLPELGRASVCRDGADRAPVPAVHRRPWPWPWAGLKGWPVSAGAGARLRLHLPW